MIHYDLVCEQEHRFDGWYKDSAAFEKLTKSALVDCPVCASTRIKRALMAPAIGKGREAAAAKRPEDGGEAVRPMASGPLPAQMLALLQRMRAEVEKNCDYVGQGFADEARRMHRGETEARGIYGEASESEADALREEGIAISGLPWVPRADG